MGASGFLTTIISGLLAQLPLILISLVGVIVSLVRWRQAPAASRWMLLSSLLSLLVCLAGPVAQSLMTAAIIEGGRPPSSLGFYYAGLGFVWATLRAVSIGMLLVAVYVGRPSGGDPGTLPPPASYTPAS